MRRARITIAHLLTLALLVTASSLSQCMQSARYQIRQSLVKATPMPVQKPVYFKP